MPKDGEFIVSFQPSKFTKCIHTLVGYMSQKQCAQMLEFINYRYAMEVTVDEKEYYVDKIQPHNDLNIELLVKPIDEEKDDIQDTPVKQDITNTDTQLIDVISDCDSCFNDTLPKDNTVQPNEVLPKVPLEVPLETSLETSLEEIKVPLQKTIKPLTPVTRSKCVDARQIFKQLMQCKTSARSVLDLLDEDDFSNIYDRHLALMREGTGLPDSDQCYQDAQFEYLNTIYKEEFNRILSIYIYK